MADYNIGDPAAGVNSATPQNAMPHALYFSFDLPDTTTPVSIDLYRGL